MEDEYIKNESEPVTSSTLSKKGRSAMSRLVNTVASLSSIFHVERMNLVQDHGLAIGEDPTGKVEFVVTDATYIVQEIKTIRLWYRICSIWTIWRTWPWCWETSRIEVYMDTCFTPLYNSLSGTKLSQWNKRKCKTVPRMLPAKNVLRTGWARVLNYSCNLRKIILHCTILVRLVIINKERLRGGQRTNLL